MLLHHRINLVFLVLLIVLYKCSYSHSVALNDGGFRPMFPAGNGVMTSDGKSWKPSTVSRTNGFNRAFDHRNEALSHDDRSVVDSENSFVPKAIPIRRSDAVPVIHRDKLYERRGSPYYSDHNETQDYFKYNDAVNNKKSIEVDDEDYSTYMMSKDLFYLINSYLFKFYLNIQK